MSATLVDTNVVFDFLSEDDEWLESVRASWRKHFDSFYSTTLYFSFPTD